MSRYAPREVVHVDLADGLELRSSGRHELVHAVFWCRDVPLGQLLVTRSLVQWPLGLAHSVAAAVAPAVFDRLHAETPAPTGRWRQPSLEEALALEEPLAALADRRASAADGTGDSAVSVIVCTRERPETLRRCLTSLETLTPAPAEIIVVDNAPRTEATRLVVERFGLASYLHEPRPGLSAARNAGVRASAGDVIAFVDDDTVVHPGWLRNVLAGFVDDRVMVVTGLVLPLELETPAQVAFELESGFGQGYRRMRFGREFFSSTRERGVPTWKIGAGASMAVRRRAFEALGLFDERLGAGASGCSEDSELWYRVLAAGLDCVYEPAATVSHEHRRDWQTLRSQRAEYTRGHVAALFVQYERHGHPGELRRALRHLPNYFARTGVLLAAGRRSEPGSLYAAAVAGYLRGLRYAPLALRRAPAELPTLEPRRAALREPVP